jgi:HAD superfamily hydrolase (TIGR01509 family)
MLKAVIFDMDGVIIDSEPVYLEVEMKLFRKYGLPIKEEEHNAFVGTTTREMWTYLKVRYGIDLEVDKLVEIERAAYREGLLSQKDLKPIAGIVDLIKNLYKNKLRLAIASSSSLNEINTVVELFDLKKYFVELVSGEEVENGKPAPDIFILASKRLEVLPSECIVIEDSKNGTVAAKQSGMRCIGYKNPKSGIQDLSSAHLVVTSFKDINFKKLMRFTNIF